MSPETRERSLAEPLSEATEEQLWTSYRNGKDQAIRDYFVRQYAPLVKYVAGKVAVRMPGSVEFDDLVGYGVFGLFDAIDKFDPSKHVKFKTYAVTRIRGAIFDELRSNDWVPRSVRQKAREVEDTVRELEATLGRSAADAEIAREMNLTLKEFQDLLLKISSTAVMSLNDLRYNSEESDRISIAESVESPSSLNPDSIAERDEIKRVMLEALQELPAKEQRVLALYYYEDLTLREIGEVLQVTESRVSQLHTKAIIRLRAQTDQPEARNRLNARCRGGTDGDRFAGVASGRIGGRLPAAETGRGAPHE